MDAKIAESQNRACFGATLSIVCIPPTGERRLTDSRSMRHIGWLKSWGMPRYPSTIFLAERCFDEAPAGGRGMPGGIYRRWWWANLLQ